MDITLYMLYMYSKNPTFILATKKGNSSKRLVWVLELSVTFKDDKYYFLPSKEFTNFLCTDNLTSMASKWL